MINALTYDEMINKINENVRDKGIRNDYIGILLTRPDLETGEKIIKSLNYFHHLTGHSVNFYLPGFGAYWGNDYPDKEPVAKIGGIQWYFSDEQFVNFFYSIEKHSKWRYSGESELLLLPLEEGILSYNGALLFYIDQMIRENSINSIQIFFNDLSRLTRSKNTIKKIALALGKDRAFDTIIEELRDNIPYGLGKAFSKEKYFCVKNLEL